MSGEGLWGVLRARLRIGSVLFFVVGLTAEGLTVTGSHPAKP